MLKVVILDGNAISRDLLNTVLTNGGHHVVGDSNISAAGLAKLIKLRPQIVCIDIGEANSDGLTLLETVRSELPKALVLLVSCKIDSAAIQGALQRGVQGFIVKPFNSVTVLATIRNAVMKFAKQQQIKRGGES
ncbi:MAG: response regulator [Oxalobacteraceae bacterium]|nr:response regulator [Oxalobacteraceae bacterium]